MIVTSTLDCNVERTFYVMSSTATVLFTAMFPNSIRVSVLMTQKSIHFASSGLKDRLFRLVRALVISTTNSAVFSSKLAGRAGKVSLRHNHIPHHHEQRYHSQRKLEVCGGLTFRHDSDRHCEVKDDANHRSCQYPNQGGGEAVVVHVVHDPQWLVQGEASVLSSSSLSLQWVNLALLLPARKGNSNAHVYFEGSTRN